MGTGTEEITVQASIPQAYAHMAAAARGPCAHVHPLALSDALRCFLRGWSGRCSLWAPLGLRAVVRPAAGEVDLAARPLGTGRGLPRSVGKLRTSLCLTAPKRLGLAVCPDEEQDRRAEHRAPFSRLHRLSTLHSAQPQQPRTLGKCFLARR